MLADVGAGELVQQEVAMANVVLLGWGQGGDDEPVTDVDVELVA